MSDIETIQPLLDATIYCSLATVAADGTPWSTPVFFGYDDNYNIYWRSTLRSAHSQNLLTNPVVAMSIYNSEQPWGEGQGLYIKGSVTVLDDSTTVQSALDAMDRRSKHEHEAKDFLAPSETRVYQCKPDTMWTNVSTGGLVLKDSRKQLEWKS